jgi:DNA-binding protein WhiA
MTFSSEVKDEFNSLAIKKNCCKKAYILGALACAEETDGMISLRITDEGTVETLCQYLKSIYRIEPEKNEIKRGCYHAFELSFKSAKLSDILTFADAFSGNEEELTTFFDYLSCEECKHVLLRAAFCACGSVSDPKKSYTLEIHIANDNRALLLNTLLEEISGEAPGITCRKGNYSIFYKNEAAIEGFLSVCGASKTLFHLLDAMIEKDFRNTENRATNCVTRNISKSVNASAIHVSAIAALKSNGMLEELPPDTRASAELRLSFPDLSLGELAQLHQPPISKSGLNHRLAKAVELAKKRNLI